MHQTPWFERTFPAILDNGLLPGILTRLEGTPCRLRTLLAEVERASPAATGWSIAQEVGHLVDLEPLWIRRAQDIRRGETVLTVADLSNRATHEGDHDSWPISTLIERFESARRTFVDALRETDEHDRERSAQHPRLGTPMRLIDLAFFVAEHDDHHMVKLQGLVAPRGTHPR